MTSMEDPEPAWVGLPLVAEQRVTLGADTRGGADEPSDRVALGRPACRRIDRAALDGQATSVVGDESEFWLLTIPCSFLARDDEPLEKSWVEARLSATGDAAPTAWSMEPSRLSDPVTVSRTVRLDASLKLTSELVPIEAGPSAGRERTSEHVRQEPYVEAFREGTPRPTWYFRRTEVTEIRGVHYLRAVVECAAGTAGRAEIAVGASVRTKLWGLVPYRARLTDLPELAAVTFG